MGHIPERLTDGFGISLSNVYRFLGGYGQEGEDTTVVLDLCSSLHRW